MPNRSMAAWITLDVSGVLRMRGRALVTRAPPHFVSGTSAETANVAAGACDFVRRRSQVPTWRFLANALRVMGVNPKSQRRGDQRRAEACDGRNFMD